MHIARAVSFILFGFFLILGPQLVQAADNTPRVMVENTDAEIERTLAEYIRQKTGWGWKMIKNKAGNEFVKFELKYDESFGLNYIIDSRPYVTDQKTAQVTTRMIRFFGFSPNGAMIVKKRQAAEHAVNLWHSTKLFPKTVVIDQNNDITFRYYILLEKDSPVYAGQVLRVMDKNIAFWPDLRDYLKKKNLF
jgi:hypothetical protein